MRENNGETQPNTWDWALGAGLLDFANLYLDSAAAESHDPFVRARAMDMLDAAFCPDTQVCTAGYKEPEPARGSEETPGRRLSRLRRRGHFTNVLGVVATRVCPWWKDLGSDTGSASAASWLVSYLSDTGVNVLGKGYEVVCKEGRDPLYLVAVPFSSDEGTRELWVCPELVAALAAVRLFRPVSEGLLATLRSRARLWAEERGVLLMDLVRFLPGTLVLASLPMPDEVVALGALRGDAGRWSADVLGSFAKGVLKAPSRVMDSWWGVLKPALRFGGPKRGTLEACGARPLQLPA